MRYAVLLVILLWSTAVGAQTCPTPVTLEADVPFAVTDTTVGHADSAHSWCDAFGPDIPYNFHIPSTGTVRARLTSHGPLIPVMLWRSSCAVDYGCVYSYSDHTDVAFEQPGPADYYLIVDGAEGTSGGFDLEVVWHPPVCGDATTNAGEQCDAGPLNGVAGSGCTEACAFAPVGAGDTCATAIPVTVPRGYMQLPLATTLGYHDDYQSAQCTTADGTSGDLVYAVTPARSGTLIVALGYDDVGDDACSTGMTNPYCWDHLLYARRVCNAQATEVACADAGALDVEVITMSVTRNVPVYVFVDGYGAFPWSHGPAALELVLL